jgi:hypothetical protein
MHSNSLERCRAGHNKARGGGFYRYQHFAQHFKKIHPGLDPDIFRDQCHFKVENSQFPRNCGFCSATFTNWRNRIDHISEHFESNGVDMRSWDKGDRSMKTSEMRHNREDDNHPNGGNNGSNVSNDDDNGHDDSGPSDGPSSEWLPEAPEPSDRDYPMSNGSSSATTIIAADTNTSSSHRKPSLTGMGTSDISSFSLLSTQLSTQNTPLENSQDSILTQHHRTPPTIYSSAFSLLGCQKTTPCKETWQTSPRGAEIAIAHDSLVPVQVDYAFTNAVREDPMEAGLLATPRFNEFPSNLLGPTLEGVNESIPANYNWGSASDDIRTNGNYSPTFAIPFHSVASNESFVSTTNFHVNRAESTTDRIFTSSSENHTTQTPDPWSESVTHVPRKRRSVSDRSGFHHSASNEQVSNSRREKRNRTKEGLDNSKEVKQLGASFRCRFENRWVSYILFCQRQVLIISTVLCSKPMQLLH